MSTATKSFEYSARDREGKLLIGVFLHIDGRHEGSIA